MMKEKIAGIAVFANLILAISKILVGIISKSSAILASGIDSSVDIVSSIISFFGIKISSKPEDKEHPYGHHKYEVLSGLVITVILLVTGIGLVFDSYNNFKNPSMVDISFLSLGVMAFSVIVNEVMSRLKIHFGKKENSISLISDGVHSRVDVYSSIAVFIGLILSKFWIHVDSILALLIGLYIIKEAIKLGKEAVSSLLDASAGEEFEGKIQDFIKNKEIKLSSIKTQKKGSAITANIEIELSKDLSVDKATSISERLKEDLIKNFEELKYISIQIKSSDIETNYYRGEFSKGISWNRKGRFHNQINAAKSMGPGGECICPNCGYKIEHIRGQPCAKRKCPKCGSMMTRT